ncbi:hypothetical protein HT576_20955 [Haloterrigena sp. SYSU A121-1]|uniref:Uncharacterized protein n=1 Tax=Haloterrigena gelatinilytica TaxID=2741724 RepID=A0A8J8GNR6_9EURY|nr:hypothetical protein [Haloterrigena gelatinilytica]NUB93469.1 hypothetical protein [Haloterrigena gelatinilytica]
MSTQDQAPYVAVCPECDVDLQTDAPNETVEFYRRHYRVTGHEVEFERAQLDLDEDVASDDLKDVVWQLQEQYENGVPIGVVAAVMSDRGLSIGETVDEIHEVRMTGGLYEPQDDHLGAF